MANPFAPLNTAPEAEWTARDHQRAANFYFYEWQDATGNMVAFFRQAHNDHARKAARLRGDGRAPTQIPNAMDLPSGGR